MIFKKLALKNFMSYSNAEIDFSGVHVACLSGPNGAGKSSLLDAVTWTLWEEGRGRTDELIKLGKEEMSSELEFLHDTELYRVYRSRSKAFKGSQGKSNLEFQIFNPTEQIWISLTLSSVRQTQDLIIKTVKMDYGTFVNSVYLRQGKADEFTTKRPNERKQILADILGLQIYDDLCEASKGKIRKLEQELSLEQSFILSFEPKILKEDESRVELEKIKSELNKQEKELKELKTLVRVKEKELNEKQEKEKQIQAFESSKKSLEFLIGSLEEQIKNIKLKKEKNEQLIKNKPKIQSDHDNYVKLKKDLNILELKKERYEIITRDQYDLERELKDKISQTEQELAVYKSKIADRNKLREKLYEVLRNENEFISLVPRVEGEITTFRNLQSYLAKIETEGLELKHSKELLAHKIDLLNDKKKEIHLKAKTLKSHINDAPCPLCKSPIKDKEAVAKAYTLEIKDVEKEESLVIKEINLKESEIKTKREEYTSLKAKIDGFINIFAGYIPELSKMKTENTDRLTVENIKKAEVQKAASYVESQLELTKNEFEKTKSQLATLNKEIDHYESEVKTLSNLLTSGKAIKEISENLERIKVELNSLQYDSKSYDAVKSELKEKEDIVLTYNSLTQAESELITLNNELEKLSFNVQSGCTELDKLNLLIERNKEQITNINQLLGELSGLKQKEFEMNNKFDNVKKQLTVLEQTLLEIEDLKRQTKDKKAKIQSTLNDKKHFEILEKAFSKNGIPVAIIETVVPEIEKEANKILSRLTESQMHVALKTQREKKSSSGLVETLDIIIADNLGTRNYELYSGGEAFKIDFALRLALSRLLANRASARLQTLIIDEGFGSQDLVGRERLVEVIRSIQNEFELILVVTHLDELKEAFPVQISVTKDEEGSSVKILA